MDPLILEQVSRLLKEGHDLVVVSVVERSGSIPSPLHSALVVYDDGSLGTIGGGLLEAKAMTEARLLLETGECKTGTVTLTDKQASDEGMLCGGTATLLWEATSAAKAGAWLEAGESVDAGEAGLFMVRITVQQERVTVAREWFSASRLDRLTVFQAEAAAAVANNRASAVRTAERIVLLEPVNPPDDLLVFGAGHLAQALVPLANSIGFRCWVIDDRSDFACRDRFQDAHKVVVQRPDAAVGSLPSGSNVWAVVVTRGHRHDTLVLKQLSERTYRYIGMIGSERKKQVIFEGLAAEGVTAEALQSVHCPIGLPIGGSSPEEIAVSIAAELVAFRYGKELAVRQ